jgi:hypothetical protein
MKKEPLMKLFSISIILIMFGSIKMYGQQQEKFLNMDFLVNVSRFLRNNLNEVDKKQSNIDEAYYLKLANENLYFLRIPFKGKPIVTDFIALETDSSGNCYKGSIVHIEKVNKKNAYLDTLIIYNLKRDENWVVYCSNPTTLNSDKINNKKELDPVMLPASSNGTLWYLDLNIFAILNPVTIEPMQDGSGFGVGPAGKTSGGFGTYSFYFDANLDMSNFLPPVADKIEFERP